MEKYVQGIGFAAGSLMLKYDMLSLHLTRDDKIQSGDRVNVFINFESILRNITFRNNINESINFHHQDVILELESSILNLVAHYKEYFKRNDIEARIFFYYTDINFTGQQMEIYNKFYRSFYHNKYMQNPQFKSIGKLITEVIVPEINMILSYVDQCYFIQTDRFDGSIIPMVIAKDDPTYKNIIITSDIYDSLYLFRKEFITIYIKRKFQYFKVFSDPEAVVQSIVQPQNVDLYDIQLFYSELYFKLLLSIKGSKIRNIKSSKGFGYGKLIQIIVKGYEKGKVLEEFNSINSIIDIFPEKYQDSMKQSFDCMSLDTQFELLTTADKESVIIQIIDQVDENSLSSLNNERFINYQINLASLI